MKILIVGSNKSWAIERFYISYLTELGAEVELYTAPDIVFDNHSKNILNKILFKTKIHTGYKEVNAGLLAFAESVKPDFIWFFKGMEIFPDTLRTLRTKYKLANYNPDHPFIIGSAGSGNKNVSDSVVLYHLHFCYHSDVFKQIEEEYKIPAVLLPFGFDLRPAQFEEINREKEINRICFLGNPDDIRENLVKFIAENRFPVDVYGHGWDKTELVNLKNVKVHDAVYGLEFWKKMRAYRVQLNIFRKHNLGSHNMRSFEIPGAGGIQLAPFSAENASFFEEGKEIFLYRSNHELLTRLTDLLNMNETPANEIRTAARKRSLGSGYSYKDRAKTVFTTFQAMMANG